ncbi:MULTISPECIES: methionine adenosyltransferase [unclassified Oceanispirochaeta]|uniref:methionine adenosyltransferase n=1 Tax=unclassified Oceanispirochaeta TaxID=2635722 RepID=UPI000E09841A|nr:MULTISPECIES: methionine adenosyltransferase [unclassified Oceanispirochaeta]MBF9015669.1 methionine adenosyltransferase [Oceanispirochaeta sp. M2]NPD73443.1 methionine adenosyltransferase [Oceanispirochaeta sp. M1]RDG30916.1 methionine adenosyltransferase [Oceanispirochaeta sp. M1]
MNSRKKYQFTSESVGEGHPDKVCDLISDAVLDKALELDKESRVACECFASTGMILVGGEITTSGYIDFIQIARDTLKDIGYDDPNFGIDYHSFSVLSAIKPQSTDISQGVTAGLGLHKEQGAGDQGLMFGYACRDTEELMPAPIQFSHQIMRKAAEVRKSKVLDFLRPDGKCQVTVDYIDGKPAHISTVVLSHQHNEIAHSVIEAGLIEEVIKKALPPELLTSDTVYHINPTGNFVIGGPEGDAGLTGRKIIVDTYGGAAAHGGGAFSGKDPSKVDRSAAYLARYIAKNLVAAGYADNCQVQLAYAIGVAEPVSLYVNTFNTGKIAEDRIEEIVRKEFNLTPAGIITQFDLKRPIYYPTAAYGHFGRPEFPWEAVDKIKILQKHL